MKLVKRIISVLLVITTVIGMMGSLVACSMSANKVKTGDWLAMIVDKFGITGYNSEEPYFSNITSDNKYFSAVQAAYEWDIIDSETEFHLEDNLSKGLAANTLVKAVGMADVEGMDSDGIAQYAVDNGYVTFKYRGRTDSKRHVTDEEAIASLDAAFSMWANYDFGAPQESLTVADDVFVVGANTSVYADDSYSGGSFSGGSIDIPDSGIDSGVDSTEAQTSSSASSGTAGGSASNGSDLGDTLGSLGDVLVDAAGDVASDAASSATDAASDISDYLSTADIEQNWLEEDVVAIPEKDVEGLKIGDTYIVPGDDGKATAAYKVEEIKYEDGYAIIRNDKEGAPFEETVAELDASGSYAPDFSQSVVYDGNGNIVSSPSASNTSSFEKPKASFSDFDGQAPGTSDTAAKASLSFSMDGLSIKGSVGKNSVSFSVSGEVYTNKSKGIKVKVSESYEIKDIKFNYDYKVKGFKLKSAYAKLDYTTVEKNTFGVSWSKTGVFEMDHDQGYGGSLLSKLKENVSLNDAAKSKGSKSIKICYIPLAGVGIAGLGLEVKLKISFSGEVELVVTTNNTRGLEYKNGKIRYINEESKDTDFVAKAKLEATIYVGASCSALGYTLIGLGIEVGAGVSASVTVHLADSNNRLVEEASFSASNCGVIDDAAQSFNGISYSSEEHGSVTLKVENCINVELYWIAKATIDTDCLISKLIDTELSVDLLKVTGIDKTIAEWHFEDGKKVSECTRKYDGTEEETTTSDSSSTEGDTGVIERGDMLDIDAYSISMGIGDTQKIQLVELPEGYTEADVKFVSANTDVATIDSTGLVKGAGEGVTLITVSTKDGKHSVSCSAYVYGKAVEFETIKPVEL